MGGGSSKDSGLSVESAVEVSRSSTSNSPSNHINMFNDLSIGGLPSAFKQQANRSGVIWSEIGEAAAELWSGAHLREAETYEEVVNGIERDVIFTAAIIPLVAALLFMTCVFCCVNSHCQRRQQLR